MDLPSLSEFLMMMDLPDCEGDMLQQTCGISHCAWTLEQTCEGDCEMELPAECMDMDLAPEEVERVVDLDVESLSLIHI